MNELPYLITLKPQSLPRVGDQDASSAAKREDLGHIGFTVRKESRGNTQLEEGRDEKKKHDQEIQKSAGLPACLVGLVCSYL